MWKTITKLVQLLGMFLAWTLRMDGSISVMHVEVHKLNYISLPLCTILMQHRSCFSNRCALYRVSAEGFRLQHVLGAVSRRNEHQESGNMAHPPWNFNISVFWNGIFNFCLCVTYYAHRRSYYGSICSLNHHFKCLVVFFSVYIHRKYREKHFSKLCMSKAAEKHVFIVIVDSI